MTELNEFVQLLEKLGIKYNVTNGEDYTILTITDKWYEEVIFYFDVENDSIIREIKLDNGI